MALTREALPLPGWCPLPDADAFDEAYAGELEVTSAEMITKIAQIKLHGESVQDYVGARYPGEQDMIKADDALLFALTQRLGGLIAEAYEMLNITDAMVIWDIMAADKASEAPGSISEQSEKGKNPLCPGCSSQRLDESGYCSKCKRNFVLM